MLAVGDGVGIVAGTGVGVALGTGVGVGRATGVGVGVGRASGVSRGAGAAVGVGVGTGVGAGAGVGCGVGFDAGKLKLSSPGSVCGAVPLPVWAAAGIAATLASKRGIALARTPREMVMYPVLTRKSVRAPE